MSFDDLILAALALRVRAVEPADLVRALARRGGEPDECPLEPLVREGLLRDEERVALLALRDARVAKLASAVRASASTIGGEADLVAQARDLGLGDEVERVLIALRPSRATSLATETRDVVDEAPREVLKSAGPRYVLGPVVGRGGIGAVHIAQDTRIGREVAIKVLRDDVPTTFERRFVREGQLTGRLEHPNIVPVHDLGEQDGRAYLCMKFIRGRDLGDVLRALRKGEDETRRKFSRVRLLQIFLGVCHGIAYAHERGVIHRDLKPRNVMVGDYGEVLVVDWGLAKAVGADKVGEKPITISQDERARAATVTVSLTTTDTAPLPTAPVVDPFAKASASFRFPERAGTSPSDVGDSSPGEIIGTPAYMAPEQARGEPATTASDIYALGTILYEILCHRPVYDGDSAVAILRQVLGGEPVPPSRRGRSIEAKGDIPCPAVPDELERLCLQCLSLDPRDRPADATALAEKIEEHLEGNRERERRRTRAVELSAQASELHAAYLAARAEHRTRLEQARALAHSVPRWKAVHEKSPVYAALAEAEHAREEAARAYDAAVARAQEALAFDDENEGARATIGALYASRLFEAEARDDRGDALLYAALARRYGASDAVAAKGTLSLETEPRGARVTVHPLHEEGPFLAPGDPIFLGTTPLSRELPAGRWIATIDCELMRSTQLSFRLARQEELSLRVPLYTHAEIGAGMVYVPPGPFLSGGGTDSFGEVVLDRLELPGFFVQRDPVTCGEYVLFLADLAIADRETALSRRPRDGLTGPLYGHENELRFPRSHDEARGHGYSSREPVVGVSWDDALAYARWRGALDGRLYRLPTEHHWEKAARGGDGRFYPWGLRFDDALANLAGSRELGPGLARVDAFPLDRSPYGMRGAAGNVREWCWEGGGTQGDAGPLRITRGGAWHDTADAARATFRDAMPARDVSNGVGFRLVTRAPER